MSKSENNEALRVEKLREILSQKNRETEFRELYLPTVPSLKNLNDQHRWEMMLPNEKINIDHMTKDRIYSTSKIAYKYLSKIKHPRILDIGIGNGYIEEILENKWGIKLEITGLDIAKKNLINLKKSFKNFKGIIGDFKHIHKLKNDSKFNAIFALEVLEHIDPKNTFGVLKKIHSIIDHTGILIVSVPINEDLKEKIASGTNYSAHVRRYVPSIIEYELKLSGFEIVDRKFLYAFQSWYKIKSIISNITKIKIPNLEILVLRKS